LREATLVVMADDEHTPSFDLPPPTPSVGEEGMEERLAQRMFPDLDVSSERRTPHNVAHYRVLRTLGRGGMGVVYEAEDQKLGRRVALKLLRRRSPLDGERQKRLLEEARTLARLSHPNVVHVYEVDEEDGDVFITMEFVEGGTLARWQRDPRRNGEILAMYLQAGAGLVAAHAEGIIHCDFKPANVLVGVDGRVRVSDFGLARAVDVPTTEHANDTGTKSSSNGQVAGTRAYAAPELFCGVPPTAGSDQYAFCVALWEALAGVRPFAGSVVDDTSTGTTPGTAAQPSAPLGNIRPRWLRRVLVRGLAIEPSARWPQLADLLAHIERNLQLRRIAWIAVPLSAVSAIAGAIALSSGPEPRSCRGAADFAQVWNPESESQLLLAAGDDPAALASARAAAAELTRYSALWATTHSEVCEAHFETHRLSAEGLDLAQGCLSDAQTRASSIIDMLIDGGLSFQAGNPLLDSLPTLSACQDQRLLRARPTSALAQLGIAAAVRPQLDHIELTLARGDHLRARMLAAELVDGTTARSPEHAEALTLLGLAERRLGELEPARVHLESAIIESEHASHPEVQFRALRELAELAAYDLDHADTASLALTLAEAPLFDLGHPSHLVADARVTAALIAETQGEHEQAEQLLREALTMHEQVGAGTRQLGRTRLRIANSLVQQGRVDEAMILYQEELDTALAQLDPDHPDIGTLYFNIGFTLSQLERWNEARPFLTKALTSQTRSYGPLSLRVAQVQTTLAGVETELGNYARAIELAEQAVTTQAERLPARHPDRDAAQAALAWALLKARDLDRSLVAHVQLLDELDPTWESQRLALHGTIGWLLCRLNRCAEAGPHLTEAVRSPDTSVRMKARALEVEWQLERGKLEAATEVMSILDAELGTLPPDDEFLAETHWLQAKLAVALGDDPVNAAEYARLADEHSEHLQADQRADLAPLLD
jgi:serine/threonine protein kinase/Tfp pilus assembly protein PilF